jgi:hypothetical protein
MFAKPEKLLESKCFPLFPITDIAKINIPQTSISAE